MEPNVQSYIKCASPICGNNMAHNHDVGYFSFPTNPARFAAWMKYCGFTVPLETVPQKHYKLCAKHFEKKMFINDSCRKLKINAVPTIFGNNKPSITSRQLTFNNSVGSSVYYNKPDLLAQPLKLKTPENNVSEMTSSSQGRQIRRRRRRHNCDQVKVILSEKKEYSVLNEHNYSSSLKIKTKRNLCKNLTEKKSAKNNANDLPDWLKVDHNDSDYEDDSEVKSLAQILKMEHEYDLKNENQNNKHAHIPLNNDKILKMLQSKSIKIIHIQKIQNGNPEIETKQNNSNYVLNVSTNPRLFIVQPPLNWVQLIYLAIKNSSVEYVSNMDVQRFCGHWFPYYLGKSWIKFINSALNEYSEVYFTCAYSIALSNYLMWTVNDQSVNTLEHLLMSAVKQNEDEIKSAMRYPDHLSTILKGYGVFQLGFNRVELNDADN